MANKGVSNLNNELDLLSKDIVEYSESLRYGENDDYDIQETTVNEFKQSIENFKIIMNRAEGHEAKLQRIVLETMRLQLVFGETILILGQYVTSDEIYNELTNLENKLDDAEPSALQKRIEAMENRIKELETIRSPSTQSLPLNKLYRGGTRRKKYKYNSINKT